MTTRLDLPGLAALVRPRIGLLVLVCTAAGYFLERPAGLAALVWALVGTLLVASAACALNHYLERDADARMERTCRRPLVTGSLSERQVILGSLVALGAGLLVLAVGAGLLAMALQAAAVGIYLGIYTPLKRCTSANTWVGAVPGAAPLLVGAAAGGGPGRLAWIAFLLIFLWQLPHFFAIASMYREQYVSGGMRMLSGDDPDDALLRWQMPLQVMSVMLVSIFPVLVGSAHGLYAVTALLVGLVFLVSALAFRWRPDRAAARRVVVTSVIYLPLVLTALVVDVACVARDSTGELLQGKADAACELCEDEPADGELLTLDDLAGGGPELVDDGTGLPIHARLPEFALVAEDGTTFTHESLAGHLWVVDFLFTRCGTTCPAMSAVTVDLLGDELPTRFLSITVDPGHDGPAELAAYRARHGDWSEDWRLLTGTSEAIQLLAEGGFRLPVNAGVEPVAGMAPMFHSGKFALVDAAGRVRGYYDYRDKLEVNRLRDDIRKLAASSGP